MHAVVPRFSLTLDLPGLATALNFDFSVLVQCGAVLADEFCGHHDLLLLRAQVPDPGERGVGTGGKVQFEALDRYVGDLRERATSDALFADESVGYEMHGDAVTL